MNRTVQQITQKLIDLLPENNQYYRLEELRTWGFPTFVIQRIRIELQRNLEESMIIPKTDWANIQSDAVQNAWQKFVDAIQAEARLPASYAKAVIETSVADIIEMLVQPRKNIPEVVFGADDELNYRQIVSRSEAIVVYPHFAGLLSRYMQKKELEILSRQQAADIIAKVDKKITARYSPLNWAQMLEPLFKLLDGSIDTNLMRLFFEDKNMPRIARQFDLMDKSLTRAEVIEVLSSPELLNFDGYEDDQANLFEIRQKKQSPSEKAERKNKDSETENSAEEQNKGIQKEPEQEYPQPKKQPEPEKEETNGRASDNVSDVDELESDQEEEEEQDDSLNAGFADVESYETEAEEEEDKDDGSLNTVFLRQDEELKKASEEEQAEPEKRIEKIEEETAEKNDERAEEADIDDNTSTIDVVDSPVQTDETETDEDEVETPMWMRYMSDEEVEEYRRREQETDEEDHESVMGENVDEDGFIDEPIIDLTQEDATDEEIEALRDQLSGGRRLFVEEIFNGSDRAYDEAVEEIAAHESWKDVSKFIEKGIFKRNMVDMYSEPAVDFTDRLQNYFMAKKNRNS